ncbi:MAG TPA: hypothetical protein VJM50_18765 [Pyrinomonadaceae bacterium]|nr:hypothetical protein [Pyrinomonadaceae bacterium]
MAEDQQRTLLRKYLLGELPESESSRLADQYFVDEKLFDDLLDVENELLDEYVSGRLPIEEQKQFRNYLICLPDGSTKLATAYALKEARHEIRHTMPVEADRALPVSTLLSRWRSFHAGLSEPRRLLQFVSAAIIIALLCGLAYLIISQRALRREVEQLRAERTQAEHERNIAAQQARENEAALRDRNLQLERELTQLKEESNPQENQNAPVLASLILTPALRSGSTPDSLSISRATKTILLVMPIPKDEQITNYSAILRTTGGQLVWSSERVKPHKSDQGTTVSLRLPTARLTQSTYKLTLIGKAADDIEIAHDFYFNIVRK